MTKAALVAWGLMIGVAHAAPTSEVTVTEPSRADRLFVSASISRGTSSLSNPVPGSTDSSGSRTELLLLASYDLTDFVLEGGAGWMRDSLTGTASPIGFGVAEYELTTDAAVIELSPLVKLLARLRAGPLLEMLVGDDVSFKPGISESPSRTAWLGGLQALYEFRLGGTALRAGARYLTSLGLPGQQLRSLQATLQFGLPLL
jgi:hypothetical protein